VVPARIAHRPVKIASKVLRINHLSHGHLIAIEKGVFCQENIVNSSFLKSCLLPILESCEFGIIIYKIWTESFLLNSYHSVTIDKVTFHNIRYWLVLWLFVKIAGYNHGDVLEIFAKKLDYLQGLPNSVVLKFLFGLQVSLCKNKADGMV
jgi:hypothetical protein